MVKKFLRQFLMVLCLSMTATGLFAQATPPEEYQPQLGQFGKDVMWLPTAQALADKMLNLAQVTSRDYVIDLGSGDGRIVITAARRGARALGIEYNPDLVALSKRNAAKAGVGDKARFVKEDLFESDFSKATVITMFLLPEINAQLRPTILNLKPGTRIVSNSFDMGDWTADKTVAVTKDEGCDSVYCQAFLWIVPARVEGAWKLPQGELTIKQNFQMISGARSAGSDYTPLTEGSLVGEQISFDLGTARYTGRVNGNTMEGEFKAAGKTARWKATRIKN